VLIVLRNSVLRFVSLRLYNKLATLEYTVRVIHSIPLHMSAVQVYKGDQMIVVSHLVGSDQLPSKHQVCLRLYIAYVYICFHHT